MAGTNPIQQVVSAVRWFALEVYCDMRAHKKRWSHFSAAVGIMAVMAFGWTALIKAWGIALTKEPVPRPAHVQVDPKTFRNVSFPDQIGPYRKVMGDGVLFSKKQKGSDGREEYVPDKDGQPDGERIIPDDVMSSLKMGTSLDESRLKDRTNNWYFSRTYEDTRPGRTCRLWDLEVFYYTGDGDTVPHVPLKCLRAGGRTVGEARSLAVEIPTLKKPWESIAFNAVNATDNHGRKIVQYWFFNVNGKPEKDRLRVRMQLGDIFKKNVFFAKIQLGPRIPIFDVKIIDEEAKDFIRETLPVILRDLPSQEDLQKLRTQN